MAMSPAEKQRAYRERQKKQVTRESLALADLFKKPFYPMMDDANYWSEFNMALGLVGVTNIAFADDSGPEEHADPHVIEGVEDPFNGASRSLGRAEVMIDCLSGAAFTLATAVNTYKRNEIKARLAEIEASDLSDPKIKKAALKDVARLTKMLDQLDKQVRWTFPAWKVTD